MTADDVQPLGKHDLATARFRMARGAGYEVREVDAFLDQAQAALSGSPAERKDFRARLARAQFRLARRSGYEVEDVDDFLDRLSATFETDEPVAVGPVGDEPADRQDAPFGRPSKGSAVQESLVSVGGGHLSPEQQATAQELGRVARQPRGSRFATSNWLFSGFQIAYVDELIEKVVQALNQTEPTSLNLSATGIPTSRPGYRKRDVETWLETVRNLQLT